MSKTRKLTSSMRRAPEHRYRSSRGFTRWELAVVLLILGLLISVLIPAITKARHRAQRISCISRLMQIGLGYRLWANDHQSSFPWQVHQREGGSVPDGQEVGSHFGELVNAFRCISNELTHGMVLTCPADRARSPAREFDPLSGAPFGGKPPAVETKNLSYLAGWDTDEDRAKSILAGDGFLGSGLTTGDGNAGLSGLVRSFGAGQPGPVSVTPTNVGWTAGWHAENGANLGLADGSTHQVGSAQWPQFLATSASLQTNLTYRLVMPRW